MRRDFIANAAHELRTPLTNLQGYLEALRDGVIDADRATYESLWEEAERLVRLSRSLDTLAEGDAGDAPRGSSSSTSRRRSGRRSTSPGRRSIAAGLELDVDVPDRLPARGDPDQLAQVARQPAARTRSATRRRAAGSTVRAERRPGDVLVSVVEHRRRHPARTTCRTSSSASTGSRSRATGRAAAPASGWRSSRSSSRRPAARVGAESRDGQTRFWFSVPSA